MKQVSPPLLQLQGISKSFGPLLALKDVNLTIQHREIHGLLGGNGAGKTTLMNVLFGLYKPNAGQVILRGQTIHIQSPRDAIHHGIGMVHQHFLQVPHFTVVQNIVLGSRLHNRPTLNLTRATERIQDLCQRFGLEADPNAHIIDLPMGVRQRVEILKALYRGVDVLILDEPTTNLTPQEVDSLFESLQRMVAEGMSVVFITHKLREVMQVCDTISVLRAGEHQLTLPRTQVSEELIVRTMVGSDIDLDESILFAATAPQESSSSRTGPPVLDVQGLTLTAESNTPQVDDVSLQVHAGEIVGIAGVAGNGQQELLEAVLGIRTADRGQIRFQNEELGHCSTRDRLRRGIAYVPEDRVQDGILPTATIAQNSILGVHDRPPYSQHGILKWPIITQHAQHLIAEYHIQTQGAGQQAGNLSGGNLQRLILARALAQPIQLLILHNPTSGLDIPTVEQIYRQIRQRRQEGLAVLLVSDDLDELMLLSDRIAVLYRGALVGHLQQKDFDKYEIGRMMSGVYNHV
ncbi:MAG: ABC transporter ATP-binding protein [Chloroflexi bacterium]|nr:ABC transporter ATP-binding protein [Chloroflexota bacterium]